MTATNREQVFRRALRAYHHGDLADAAEGFQQLVREGSSDPRHISYCGLLVATVEGRIGDGRVLCELALREAAMDVEMYINLARLYASIGHPSKVFEVLEQAHRIAPKSELLRRERSKLERRSRPAFPFLRRSHALNRKIGRIRTAAARWLRWDRTALT